MTAKQPPPSDEEKAEEARHVAEDAIEAAQQGDTEEARFLAGEAKSLDKDAARTCWRNRRWARRQPDVSTDKPPPITTPSANGPRRAAAGPAWCMAPRARTARASCASISRRRTRSLDEVDWDTFFRTFEDRKLALLYQDKTADGHTSRFFKFVQREG